MALDETGLLVRLEADINRFRRDFDKGIAYQRRTSARMEQLARRNADQIGKAYEGLGPRIGRVFDRIPASVKGLGGAFLGGMVGGLALGGIDQMGRSIAAATKEVANLRNEASRAGVSTSVFQEWKFLADQNRISIDALTDGFKEMHLRAGEFFLDGSGAGAAAFQKLGYSAEDLKRKLEDPSALMTEILGKLNNFDQAGRSFLLEELFGGAGGEQLGILTGQGEAKLRATIARAHELGLVQSDQMIARTEELDRRFSELSATVEAFGKRTAVALADAVVEMGDFRERLDGIFDTEAEGRSILGDEIYDSLARDRQAVDDQAEALHRLDERYSALAEEADRAGMAMRRAVGQLDSWGYDDAADALRNASAEMDELTRAFRAGEITGEEFSGKLAEIETAASDAFSTLEAGDRVQFSGVMSQLSRLGGVIASVASLANDLTGALARAAGVDAGAKAAQALRDRHAAEAASMDSLNAQRAALDGFTASEQARNAATSEQLKLQREIEAVQKRAAEAGATLTAAQAEAAARAAITGEEARAAADRAGRGAGSGADRSGGGSDSDSLDQFAREAEAIRNRTMLLQSEAAVLVTLAASGQKVGDAMDFAATKARLLVTAQEAGKAVTPALEAQIDALAQSYVAAGHAAEQAAQKSRDIEGATKRGADAFTNLAMAATEGSAQFANALRDLGIEIMRNQALKLMGGLASGGGFFGGFFGGLGTLLGFSEGGFTGPGSKHQPAGIVHAGEYVFSAESVRRIGAGNLDQMHRAAKSGARGYANGGMVSGAGKVAATVSGRSGDSPVPLGAEGGVQIGSLAINTTVNVAGQQAGQQDFSAMAEQISREVDAHVRTAIQSEMVRQMRPGGLMR